MGTLRHEASQGCVALLRTGPCFSWRGSAERPLGSLSMVQWGHDDDDLPKPEARGIISAYSIGALPLRPDILSPDGQACTLHSALYSVHSTLYTHMASLRPMLH